MTNWIKPPASELTEFQKNYVAHVPTDDLLAFLETLSMDTSNLLTSLPADKLEYRYAEGKWSIPQILLHVIDTERIFAFRILSFARGEKAVLPGFEENDYAEASNADERDFSNIMEEYQAVRKATLCLLRSLTDEQILKKGISNGKEMSVRALAYMLAGHEVHHINVIGNKYLS